MALTHASGLFSYERFKDLGEVKHYIDCIALRNLIPNGKGEGALNGDTISLIIETSSYGPPRILLCQRTNDPRVSNTIYKYPSQIGDYLGCIHL
jgi:hypothetical protein